MCLWTIEPDLLTEAGDTADDILYVVYGIDVAKALDPLKNGDYQKIVKTLGNSLRRTNAAEEAAAMREALQILDVDWPNMTGRQRNAIIKAATDAFSDLPANVLPQMGKTMHKTGNKTIKGTKKSSNDDLDLGLETNFTTTDKKISKVLSTQQTSFIRDEYGRRQVGFSKGARNIVGNGLDQGLGRAEISADLARAAKRSAINRNKWYWDLIASTFTNRSRTYAQLSSFDEAGISRYVFEAVVDEATSEVCRFMDRKVFEVPQALNVYQEMNTLSNPEDVKNVTPWVSSSRDAEGNQIIAYRQPNGDKQQVARVDKPGLGSQRRGTYSDGLLDEALAKAGIMMPPLHGFCRSTILADI